MQSIDYKPEFHKTVLDNGVRVITEHHPFARSTQVGVFVDTGTRDEPADLMGAAHFVEHLVFKGTKKRSAYQIAKALEAVGGDLNAYTSREYTCFHAVTLNQHLPLSLDVLADLVSHARFNKGDFETERQVIVQEIDMAADVHEEYIFDMFFEKTFANHPLGRSILGTYESLEGMNRTKLYQYYQRRYHGKNMIVSVAGNVNHHDVVKIVSKTLSAKKKSVRLPKRERPRPKSFRQVIHKKAEQVHVLFGLPASAFREEYRFEAFIVNAVLGGGMTSRLYQRIREKHGLAYSVYSSLQSFTDTGLLTIYAGTSEDNLKKVLTQIHDEVKRLKSGGVTPAELKLFKTQVLGMILMGAEDMENRMNSIAVNEMIFEEYRPVEKVVEEIEQITTRSVKKFLDQYLDLDNLGLLVMGDVEGSKFEKIVEGL